MLLNIPDIEYWNLVVRANPELPMDTSRMLESTEKDIKQKLFPNGGYDLLTLAALPVVMTREFDDDDPSAEAVIGYMDIHSLNPQVSHPIMRIKSQALIDCGFLYANGWGGHRTHWAIKRGNPFKLFAAYAIPHADRQQEPEVKTDQVAVMMPFDKGPAESDPVYRAISKGASSAGFTCRRVDELKGPNDITQDLRNLIKESGVVIADLTGPNPNVMYELGFADACNKPTYIVTADGLEDLPFDIRQQRSYRYETEYYGMDKLTDWITDSLSAQSR